MVQHVADWVAPFPRSQHSPLPSLKIVTNSPLSFPIHTLRARELGAIIITDMYEKAMVVAGAVTSSPTYTDYGIPYSGDFGGFFIY